MVKYQAGFHEGISLHNAPSRSFSWLLVSFLGLATAAISLFAVSAEQSHLLASGTTPIERADAFISGQRQVGLATITQRWFVIDCRNTTIIAYGLPEMADRRDDLATACLLGARRIVAAAPNSSFAWFGAAHASVALQDWDGVNAYLAQSFATGAQEGWIGRYRVELVGDNLASISPDNLEHYRNDVQLLAGNMPPHAAFLATEYLQTPEMRPLITEIIEAQPALAQRQFLNAVEAARRAPSAGQN